MLRGVACLGLVFGLSACERGCLATWLSDRSPSPIAGGESPRGSSSPDAAGAAFDLAGTDCSDGLARCVEGRVEISLAGHVPHPCGSPRERGNACECPWRSVGQCATGCVKDGLEVVATGEVALVQLCAASEPVVRPVAPTD